MATRRWRWWWCIPSPKPDLSQLPSGTSGDVIVDVVIDKDGRIAKYTMMRGIGHGVDQTVLATIQQWTVSAGDA